MNEIISAYIFRLFIGGFAVFSVMSIAGKGSVSEPVRLCCACFMIILILTPVISSNISLSSLKEYFEKTENDIAWQVEQAQATSYNQINDEVERYIEKNLFSYNAEADVDINFFIDENGAYVVDNVIVRGVLEEDDALKTNLAEITGVQPSDILFER